MLKRILLLAVVLLVSACVSHKEPPVVKSTPPVVKASAADEVSISAMSLIGIPYLWGGNTPASGFDCSGLIVYVFRNSGVKLPRTTSAMSQLSAPSVKRNALKTGDVVFFATSGKRKVSHAGIYVGDGRFVHAPSTGGSVKLSSLSETYWRNSFLLGKRIIQN